MRKRIYHIGGFILLTFLSLGWAQTTYYVASNGNDNNPGTIDRPWSTLQHAVTQVQSGDNIILRQGTYAGDIVIKNSGTADKPITIQNQSDEPVKIDASGTSFGITFDGCHYVTVRGLHITNANGPNNETSNIYLRHKPSHIRIENCEISYGRIGILNSKMWTDHRPTYITIKGCNIHHHELEGIRIFGTKESRVHNIIIADTKIHGNGHSTEDKYRNMGIYIHADSSVIENCQISENKGDGIYMAEIYPANWPSEPAIHSYYNIVRGNEISDNGYNGIMLWHQYTLIHDNKIHGNGTEFALGTPNARAMHGVYMMMAGNCIIFNNDMYGHKNGSAVRLEGRFNVIRDNHFHDNGISMYSTDRWGPTAYGNIIRHNRMHRNTQLYDSAIPGSGIEADGTEQLRMYHNVFFDNQGYGCAFVTGASHSSSYCKIKNNIIMNDGWEHIWVKTGSEKGYHESHNLIYPDKPKAVKYVGKQYSLDDYYAVSGQGKGSLSSDPNFVNSTGGDFHLNGNSPAIDAGDFLTHIRGIGSGTELPVEDAFWFSNGFGLTKGDLIQLEGTDETARVTRIDYDKNMLILDRSLDWYNGQGVSLSYKGKAPDMGVYETISGGQQPINLKATLTLSDPSPTKGGDVVIVLAVNQPVVRNPGPLLFQESDGSQTQIELQGNVPGIEFQGVFKVDASVADGEGWFLLAENALEDAQGNTAHQISPEAKTVIDQSIPQKPQRIVLKP